ncbi:cytochrome P450 704C1-like [Cynara cardunculus var. scolymus]|uniref:cytochrome P450 704C1-like n=1 Tax=Cynara cardunculus var. scolymus TaxID=59895 RepID=UPI000D628CE0|nr:cytochrome P450 704C1-like [Cynara cardunculus var. scolymus]
MATSIISLSNPIFILIITALFLLLSVYIYNKPQKKGKTTKKYHPVGGTKFHQFIHFRRLHHYCTDLARKYKTYRIYSPHNSEIYTTDPANVEYILRTNFDNYGKGSFMNHTLKDLLGDGIFTVDGDEWREQRKVSSHEFSKKVLRDFSGVVFTENTIKVGNILSKAASSNQTVDITDLFMKSTTDSIFKVAFGIDFDNISGSNEKGARFCRAFDDANELVLRRFFDLSWKIQKFFNIGPEAELKKNIKVIDDIIYKLIQTKIEKMREGNDDTLLKKQDLLSRFLQIKDIDQKYVRDIVVTFVLAGKDPIATSLYWFIYMLCKHPQIQDKVAKEIKEATNMSMKELEITDVAEFATRVTEEALDKMQYLHAALTETIRLYPALSMDDEMYFQVGEYILHYGREEFCLVTGLRYGSMLTLRRVREGFIHKIFGDRKLMVRDVIHVLGTIGNSEGEEDDLEDVDDVRVCLMMMVEIFFLGPQGHLPVTDTLIKAIENFQGWNHFPWGSFI